MFLSTILSINLITEGHIGIKWVWECSMGHQCYLGESRAGVEENILKYRHLQDPPINIVYGCVQ